MNRPVWYTVFRRPGAVRATTVICFFFQLLEQFGPREEVAGTQWSARRGQCLNTYCVNMSERRGMSPGVRHTTTTFERRGTPMSTRASPSQRRSSESPQPKPVLQKLSGLTIGMWKSRAHESLYLLVLPSTFVFVVEAGPKPSVLRTSLNSPRLVGLNSLNTLNTSLSASPILKQFVSASPFSCGQHAETGVMMFAFEVRFDSVAGVDYQNPLVRQGRLTLEALGVTRR